MTLIYQTKWHNIFESDFKRECGEKSLFFECKMFSFCFFLSSLYVGDDYFSLSSGLEVSEPRINVASESRGRQRRTETNNPIISPLTALMSWFQSLRDDFTLTPFETQQTQ